MLLRSTGEGPDINSSPWIWKGVSATSQSGKYTLYIQGDELLPGVLS